MMKLAVTGELKKLSPDLYNPRHVRLLFNLCYADIDARLYRINERRFLSSLTSQLVAAIGSRENYPEMHKQSVEILNNLRLLDWPFGDNKADQEKADKDLIEMWSIAANGHTIEEVEDWVKDWVKAELNPGSGIIDADEKRMQAAIHKALMKL